MMLVVPKKALTQILRWVQRALVTGAALTLAYCGFVLVDGWIFQNRESHRLDQALQATHNASAALLEATAAGGLIGRITVPRLGLSVMVTEGVDRFTLGRAAGHIPGTALPGQPGNVGISAHRDTFFRPLRNIRQNDVITLTTVLGEYRYRVVSTKVVSPHDVEVLDSNGDEILTLITCYPFYFVGSAPNRFVVRAARVG